LLTAGLLASPTITTVSVDPESVTAETGQIFSLNVNVTNVTDPSGLYGWQFELNWTASILSVSSIVEGPFLKSGGSTFFYYTVTDAEGHMIADCTLEGPIEGVTGSGVLATITFSVGAAGQSALDLYNATLVDSNQMDIQCQVVGGYGNFTDAPPIAAGGKGPFLS
jgi:hypothetical protein